MFSHWLSVGPAKIQALNRITFYSDRGYWTALLILFLLELVATVFGTLRCMEWVPFTYGQPERGQDRGERIEKNFDWSIFQAFARWGCNMIKTVTWRSGTSSVSLAMTSDCDENESQVLDFCFASNADADWYKFPSMTQDERNLKAFQGSLLKDGEGTEQFRKDIDTHLKDMANDDVKMLTVSDHCLAWFVICMFSFTSSTIDAALRNTAPYIPSDNIIHSSFQQVLGFAGLSQHLSSSSSSSSRDDATDGDMVLVHCLTMSIQLMIILSQQPSDQCDYLPSVLSMAVQRTQFVSRRQWTMGNSVHQTQKQLRWR